jgi:DNA-binding CsgD family transcriptional regulator
MTDKLLAGLVSEEAAAAYDRLHDAGHLPVGDGPGEFDVTSPPGQELREAGLISFAGTGENRFVKVASPSMALRRLLDRQHRRLAALQNDLGHTWERFASLVSPTSGLADDDLEIGAVRTISDRTEMARLAAGMYQLPRRLLRATFTARSGDQPTTHGLLLPPPDSLAAGVEFRMLYDARHAADQWGSYSIEQSVKAGEQARVRPTVPLKMMHVDDTVALITIDKSGSQGALHIESPGVLALLAEWFDAMWTAPDTTVIGDTAQEDLTPVRRRVLTLLAAGLTDESIANHTGTGVRTVRRHISAIMEILQVDSRFAAGVAAAKRGWL